MATDVFVFFYPWKTHLLHLSRLLSERSCGPKRHSIASPPGWLGGVTPEGWSKPVEGWLDDWRVGRNLESSAGTGGEVALQDAGSTHAGRTKMTTSRPIDLFWAHGNGSDWIANQVSSFFAKKTGFKFHPEILAKKNTQNASLPRPP